MTDPSTPLDLDAIGARYDKIKSGPPRLAGFNALRSARDVPDLLAEVERLRAELDTAEWEAALLARQRDAVIQLCDEGKIHPRSADRVRSAFLTDPADGEVLGASS